MPCAVALPTSSFLLHHVNARFQSHSFQTDLILHDSLVIRVPHSPIRGRLRLALRCLGTTGPAAKGVTVKMVDCDAAPRWWAEYV